MASSLDERILALWGDQSLTWEERRDMLQLHQETCLDQRIQRLLLQRVQLTEDAIQRRKLKNYKRALRRKKQK